MSAAVDDLAETVREPAWREMVRLINSLMPDDFTACEIVAIVTVMRGAWARKQAREAEPAPVIRLVNKLDRLR